MPIGGVYMILEFGEVTMKKPTSGTSTKAPIFPSHDFNANLEDRELVGERMSTYALTVWRRG